MKLPRIILIALFGSAYAPGFCQSSEIDSLQAILKMAREDTNKINLLNKLGLKTMNSAEYEKSIGYLSDAISLSEKLGFKKGKANANNTLGIVRSNQGNYMEGLKNLETALTIRKEINDQKGIAGTTNNIGLVYQWIGNYPEALKMFFAALKINEVIGNKNWIAANYNNIGNIYSYQKNYHEAIKNLSAARDVLEEIGDRNGMNHPYNNMGNIYLDQGNYPEALKNYTAALKIREAMGDTFEIANSISNIGSVYQRQGNYAEALKNHYAALSMAEHIGNKTSIAASDANISAVKFELKQYPEARNYLNKALALNTETGNLEGIGFNYKDLSGLDSATGNYKSALVYYKKYTAIQDSLFNEDNTKKLVQAQMQYDFDKKETAAIAEQGKKDAVKNAEIKNQKLIRNFSLIAAVAVLIFALYAFYRYKKKKQLQNQQALMNERLRISRELHDEVGATLSGIAMYSHLAKEQIKTSQGTEIEKSLNIMQQSSGEMVNKLNDIVWLINPEQDSLQKLIERLEEYARDMGAIKNMQVKITVPDKIAELNLPIENRRNIYLFCKEAINNSVKYSNGSLLELTVKKIDNKLEFSVSDNGKGFDAVMVRRGNGLENMQKRADEIGAKLILQSKLNEGASLSLQCKIT